ncbi:MAG: tetratricopeptide repeat protein [bacterium]|nr:tetratricopeptide repeat protein [bacterium]
MKNLILLTATASIVLASCGDINKLPAKVQKQRQDVVLSEEDIFKGNLVAAFLENDKKYVQESNTLFLRGVDSYRNNKKLDSAVVYFTNSILKEPSAKAYFELGNVHMDQKNYEDALNAYKLAEQLGYQPFSKILYNKACIYSLKKDTELSAKYLEYALQAGYTNVAHMQNDSDLENLRSNKYTFQKAVDRGLRGVSNAENLFWLQFTKMFPALGKPIKLKMALSQEESQALEYISYDYEKYISEMRDAKFARDVTSSYLYYANAYETDKFVALVYVVKDEWMGDAAPLRYKMATFTHEGKLIDKRIIAGSSDSDLDGVYLQSTLNKDLTISGELVKPKYQKDPDEHGYYENKILSYKKVGTQNFRITKAGKIVEEEVSLLTSN